MPNLHTWPSDYHSSSRTSAEESCTYNYSKTLPKIFSLKLIRSQANTTALLILSTNFLTHALHGQKYWHEITDSTKCNIERSSRACAEFKNTRCL